MRGFTSALGVVLGAGFVGGFATPALAEEPIGPAATMSPSLTVPTDEPVTVAPTPLAATDAAPTTTTTTTTTEVAPVPSDGAGPVMRDPFRPDQGGVTLTPSTGAAPVTTTTTTTVVTERVHPMPAAPRYQQPPRDRFFLGGYGGFAGRLGPVSGRVSSFSEIRGGILLGQRLSIGGSLVRMTKRFGGPIEGISGQQYQLGLIYGGVDVGIVAFRRGRFEMGVQSLFGAGVGCVRYAESKGGDCSGSREAIRLVVVDPSLFMHVNLTNWARFGLSGGYRVVARPPWPSGADFRMSAPYFGASIEFGWFRRRDT
jgi:hypothetical protein